MTKYQLHNRKHILTRETFLLFIINIIVFELTGDVPAIMHLAHCYSHGSGTESDYTKAFELHLAAAEVG